MALHLEMWAPLMASHFPLRTCGRHRLHQFLIKQGRPHNIPIVKLLDSLKPFDTSAFAESMQGAVSIRVVPMRNYMRVTHGQVEQHLDGVVQGLLPEPLIAARARPRNHQIVISGQLLGMYVEE